MNTGIFGKLSAEARGETIDGKTNFTVEDAIDNDGVYDEIVAIGAEAHADAAIMNQYALGAESMERQIEMTESMLQNPASIVSGTVTLARESFEATAMMLGATSSDIDSKLSNESIESNPSAAMEIGNEGVKDFLKKTWGVIKLIFKRIINGIKKLVVKVVVAMNGTAKKAKAYKTSMKKDSTNKASKTKHESDVGKKINSRLGAFLTLGMLSASKTNANLIDNGFINAVKAIGDYKDAVGDIVKKVDAVSAKGVKGKDSYVPKVDAVVGKDAAQVLDGLKTKLKTYRSEDVINLFDIDDVDQSTVTVQIPLYPKGKNLVYFELESDSPENGDEDGLDDLAKVKMVVRHAGVKNEIDDDAYPIGSKEEIESLLTELYTSSTTVKKFAENRLKEIETLDKEGAKAADNATGNKYINRMKSNMMNHARAFVVGASLDSILAFVSTSRALLWYAKENARHYSKTEL